MLDLPRLARSFLAATNGLFHAIYREQNLRIHLFVSVLVVLFGFFFHISTTEWCLVVLCMGLVCSLELVNTAIERTVDKANHLSPQSTGYCELSRRAKDTSAAAVLLASLAAVIIGLIIFVPKVLSMSLSK